MPEKIKHQSKNDHITFGALQHEIDQLLDEVNENKPNKEIEKSIMRELAKYLPAGESVSEKKKRHHANIVVKSTGEHATHSPYVLDITSLIEQKKKALEKKEKVKSAISRPKHELRNNENLCYSPHKMIIAEHEEFVVLPNPIGHAGKKIKDHYHKQFTKTPLSYHFNLPIHWHRSAIMYLAVCLLVILPIKGFGYYQSLKNSQDQIINYAESAYEDLKIAGKSFSENNAANAEKNFASAEKSFKLAINELDKVNGSLKAVLKIIPTSGANIQDAEYLLLIGEKSSQIGKDLARLFDSFSSNKYPKLTDKISALQRELDKNIPAINDLNNYLNKLNIKAVPEDKQKQFETVKTYFSQISSDLKELNSLSAGLNEILGKDYKRRYLVMFQNNNELRPTGGFMGSFALIDIDRGEIKKMEIPGGGTYDLQGQLLEKIIAPYPLHIVNARWEFQDANWFPDFPTSAKKISWFYEKAGGPTVDGVIAINSSLIPKLLAIVGPVEAPDFNKNLNAENFISEIQKTVEFEYDKSANKPKQILSDIAPQLLSKLFSEKSDNLLKLAGVIKDALNQKEIQLYFRNGAIEEKFASLGWTGEIKESSKDYLAIINSNIRGYKTDGFIKQTVRLDSEIQEDGSVINKLTIARKHNGEPGDIFGGKSNIDFMRIYTPLGSQLISSEGWSQIPQDKFESPGKDWQKDSLLDKISGEIWVDPASNTQINNEFNKTVFGNWIQTNPGEEKTISLQYKLPFKVNLQNNKAALAIFSKKDNGQFHSLFLQKQSGQENADYEINFHIPGGKKITWAYPESAKPYKNQISAKTPLNADQLIAFIIE